MTTKRMLVVLILCAVVFGGVFGMKEFGRRSMVSYLETMPLPTVTVSAARAEVMRWEPVLNAVGSLVAENGTDVTIEEGGIVSALHFSSGEPVEKGDLLLELDAASERAELERLEAEAELAALTLSRRERLFKLESISRADLDEAQSQAKVARAAVAAQRARLDLKRVRAPFSGVLGIRRVSLGQYLAPGTAIVALESLDPIEVDFALPEADAARVQPGTRVTVAVEALGLTGLEGEIFALESRVDEATRTVGVRARLPNPEHRLRPGQFARVEVQLPGVEEVIAIPRTAVQYGSYGDSVYVVVEREAQPAGEGEAGPQGETDEAELEVERRFVTLGTARGDYIAVVKGLKAGERVASSGLLKLRNGQPVAINNELAPDTDLQPQPPQG